MKKRDWGLEIRKVKDGFIIKDSNGDETVAKESEDDEISAAEDLLHQIIEFFGLRGNRYDRERIRVVREVGNKYTPQEGERVVHTCYAQVTKKRVLSK